MSEPALANAPTKSPVPDAAPQEDVRAKQLRPQHPIGDLCVSARIVGTQIEGKQTRLLMAVPRGTDVRVGGHGHVDGVADSGFRITAILDEKPFVVAHSLNRLDIAELAGHSKALIECQPQHERATAPVKSRIIKREGLGGTLHKVTLAAGYAQGVFPGMRVKLGTSKNEQFPLSEVSSERRSTAIVNETADELIAHPEVVILP